MAKPKHDYDSIDFYKRIEQLAMNGYTDTEIANELDLSADVFGSMKNGNYQCWDEEEKKRRGDEIHRVLAHGQTRILALLRGTYIKGAIGGKKTKSRIVKYVQDKCECMGADKKCPYCGGTGWVTLTDKAVVQESEMELPPNMQAIATYSITTIQHGARWRTSRPSCDLPKNIYLCGSNNNPRSAPAMALAVVICLKISIFVVAITTLIICSYSLICCDLLKNIYLCGSNNNSSSSLFCSFLVVICLKISIFVVAITTDSL